ncbi:MAG: EAL domain-containing protein [Chromatiales bacterium]|nr:EAL domain-containing protein [Chromatiales bacterium]
MRPVRLRSCAASTFPASRCQRRAVRRIRDRAAARPHRLPAALICFEITETAAIANLGTRHRASSSRAASVSAAGSRSTISAAGLSSFAYLKNLPVDFLKIDGGFIKDMLDDPMDHAMVEAINRIGHVAGLKTVAEFVESDAVIRRLTEIGVDYGQGYGIQRPVPLQAETWVPRAAAPG